MGSKWAQNMRVLSVDYDGFSDYLGVQKWSKKGSKMGAKSGVTKYTILGRFWVDNTCLYHGWITNRGGAKKHTHFKGVSRGSSVSIMTDLVII